MTSRIATQIPYLRAQRTFPEESQPLSVEIDKTYLDVANAVNQRTISTYSSDITFPSGESWYLQPNGRKGQGFRKVYEFTSAGTIAHGIAMDTIRSIIRLWGVFTDNLNNWYPLPYIDVTAANNQISLTLSSTNIVITAGAGAPPTISSGLVIIEWIT